MTIIQLQYPTPISKRKLSPIYPTAHQSTHFAIGLPHSEFQTSSEYHSNYVRKLLEIDLNQTSTCAAKYHIQRHNNLEHPRKIDTPSFNKQHERTLSNSPPPIQIPKQEHLSITNNLQNPLRNSKIAESLASMTPSKFGANLYKMHYDGSLEAKTKQALLARDIKQLQEIKEIARQISDAKEKIENSRIEKQSKEILLRREYQSIQYSKVIILMSTKKSHFYFINVSSNIISTEVTILQSP